MNLAAGQDEWVEKNKEDIFSSEKPPEERSLDTNAQNISWLSFEIYLQNTDDLWKGA